MTTIPKHARGYRVRKPNRRRGSIAAVTVKRAVIVFLAAFFLGAVFPALGAVAAHAATVTATPAQEAAACSAAYHFHHVSTVPRLYADEALWRAAREHAWDAARHADPVLRRDIDTWINAERGWSLVRYDCNPDEGL